MFFTIREHQLIKTWLVTMLMPTKMLKLTFMLIFCPTSLLLLRLSLLFCIFLQSGHLHCLIFTGWFHWIILLICSHGHIWRTILFTVDMRILMKTYRPTIQTFSFRGRLATPCMHWGRQMKTQSSHHPLLCFLMVLHLRMHKCSRKPVFRWILEAGSFKPTE